MTGQLTVLARAVIVLVAGWPLIIPARKAPLPILGLWTGICVIMLVATAWRAFDPAFYGTQPALPARPALKASIPRPRHNECKIDE